MTNKGDKRYIQLFNNFTITIYRVLRLLLLWGSSGVFATLDYWHDWYCWGREYAQRYTGLNDGVVNYWDCMQKCLATPDCQGATFIDEEPYFNYLFEYTDYYDYYYYYYYSEDYERNYQHCYIFRGEMYDVRLQTWTDRYENFDSTGMYTCIIKQGIEESERPSIDGIVLPPSGNSNEPRPVGEEGPQVNFTGMSFHLNH